LWPQLLWRKNDFGNSENWEYSSVPNGGCFEATVRWADQLTVKDFTSFLVILVLQQLNNLDHICSSDDLNLFLTIISLLKILDAITELPKGSCDTNVLLPLHGYALQFMPQKKDFPHESSMSDSKAPGLLF